MTSLTYKGITGFFNPPEAELYNHIVSLYPEGKLIEIGTWKGLSISTIIELSKKLNYQLVACVDTWEGSKGEILKKDGSPSAHYEALEKDLYEVFKSNIINNIGQEYWNLITPMKMKSIEAAEKFEDNYLDIVFIDSDHSYESVCQDIDAWLPKIRYSGILFGHDINWHEGVEQAVNEKFKSTEWINTHNCWVYQK